MKRIQFTKDFYEHLYDSIQGKMDDVIYDFEAEGYDGTFTADGFTVEATIYYGWEVHDESFDHAFGTWHDPNPYMMAVNIEDIRDVHVYDEDSDEEVEGFDYCAFMEQFEKPTYFFYYHDKEKKCYRHVKVSHGDKVLYNGHEAVFLAYNTENCKLKIMYNDIIMYREPRFVKYSE